MFLQARRAHSYIVSGSGAGRESPRVTSVRGGRWVGILDFALDFEDRERTFLDAALFLVEASPATRARVGALGDGVGAVGAADAGVGLVVQLVVGDAVGHDVRPDLLLIPGSQRAELDEIELLIPFDDADFFAGL